MSLFVVESAFTNDLQLKHIKISTPADPREKFYDNFSRYLKNRR